jgi:hypothetical protein
MTEILDIFTVIGFCTTIYFIGKLVDERKMNKLADKTARRLREERRREQLEAEWSNMTKGNGRGFLDPATGRWWVFEKVNDGQVEK